MYVHIQMSIIHKQFFKKHVIYLQIQNHEIMCIVPSLLVSSCGIAFTGEIGVFSAWTLSTSELEKLELVCPTLVLSVLLLLGYGVELLSELLNLCILPPLLLPLLLALLLLLLLLFFFITGNVGSLNLFSFALGDGVAYNIIFKYIM